MTRSGLREILLSPASLHRMAFIQPWLQSHGVSRFSPYSSSSHYDKPVGFLLGFTVSCGYRHMLCKQALMPKHAALYKGTLYVIVYVVQTCETIPLNLHMEDGVALWLRSLDC